MNDTRRKLEELWKVIFEHEQFDMNRLAKYEQDWRQQRPQHLPLTLNVMLQGIAPLEYGRREQTDEKRVLLLMVGYTEEQLALSIAAHVKHDCKKIVPFSSPTVWAGVQSELVACLQDLDLSLNKDYQFEPLQKIEPNDPADVFRKVMHWVRENPNSHPAVECTGGKKPMDSGSAYAASFYGLPAYYLDFDSYDRKLRRPFPWTCRYHRLSLPDAVFSLATRQGVLKLFEARRFAEAQALLLRIVEAPQAQEYLEEPDWQDLVQATQLVHRCDCWMQLRYDDESLNDHELHQYFVDARENETKPRAIIEALLHRNRFVLLHEYVVDEYWRLWSLWAMQEFREALIGCVGLVELIVDALFFLPWFDRVRIDEVTPRRWVLEENQDLPTQEQLGWQGQPIDPRCLPRADYRAKVTLLKKGTRKFEVWAQRDGTGTAKLVLPTPRPNDPRLEVEVILTTTPPPLQFSGSKGKMDDFWRQHWGNYPDNSWVDARHALVHMRTPAFLDANLGAGLKNAIERVLPRFIELLFRMPAEEQVDITSSDDHKWVTWQTCAQWNRDSRLPWARQETVMAEWLRLKVWESARAGGG